MWSLNEIRKLINFSTWSVYPQPGCWWRSTNTWSSTSTIEWTGRPTPALHKGWMNRLYFLRMLRSFSLCSKMLEIFSVCCNGGSLKCAGWAASELVTFKDGINRLERLALCLHFGCKLDTFEAVVAKRLPKRLLSDMDNPDHPPYWSSSRAPWLTDWFSSTPTRTEEIFCTSCSIALQSNTLYIRVFSIVKSRMGARALNFQALSAPWMQEIR